MPAPAGKVPIIASVRAGLAFVRTRWRALAPIAFAALAGTLVISVLARFAVQSPAMAFLSLALNMALIGAVYAAFLGVALKEERRGAWPADAMRLLAAMAIVGFFLMLIMFVAFMAGGVLISSMLAPYAAEIEAAQGDPAVMNALIARLFADNPAPFLAMAAIYAAAWLGLTSRLYLAAPATVAENAVRTFETWAWTKGSALRIAAARLVLLAPPTLLLLLVQNAVAQGAAAAPDNVAAQAAAAALVLIVLLATLVVLALEAGLSAFLYRGLRPPA